MKPPGQPQRRTPLQRKAPICSQSAPQREGVAKPKKRKSGRSAKITKEDRAWAVAVKERDGWRCRRCGKTYQRGDRGLQAMHIFSRRFKATRHDLMNGLAGCTGCHMWGHSHPGEFLEWVASEIGSEALAELKGRAVALRKRTPQASQALKPSEPPGSVNGSLTTGLALDSSLPSREPASDQVSPAAGQGWRSS